MTPFALAFALVTLMPLPFALDPFALFPAVDAGLEASLASTTEYPGLTPFTPFHRQDFVPQLRDQGKEEDEQESGDKNS